MTQQNEMDDTIEKVNELVETEKALSGLLDKARSTFINALQECKMHYDVVKVVKYMLHYPVNGHIELKKEQQKIAAAHGSAWMQLYKEHSAISTIIGMSEEYQRNVAQKQGVENGEN